MQTKISVIVAVYNGADTLERCIKSVLNQKFEDYDLLISDGNSSDGTVKILEKYSSKMYFWESKPDTGIADAWNNALQHIRSDWVLFIGADDYLSDDFVLKDFAEKLDENKELDIFHGNLILRYDDYDHHIGEVFNSNKFKRRMTIPHTAAFHNSKLFKNYGIYDTSYKIALDYEFLLRKDMLKVGYFDRLVTIMATGGISSNLIYKALGENRKAHIKNKTQARVLIEFYYVLYVIKHLLGNK